jgi:hypothetical protein
MKNRKLQSWNTAQLVDLSANLAQAFGAGLQFTTTQGDDQWTTARFLRMSASKANLL